MIMWRMVVFLGEPVRRPQARGEEGGRVWAMGADEITRRVQRTKGPSPRVGAAIRRGVRAVGLGFGLG